jgi:macrolide transport system ATP-binding/permease protein
VSGETEATAPVVELAGLSHAYGSAAGPIRVLDGVDLRVRRGDWVAVLGRSGAGKSTLFYLLSGLIPAESGTVRIDGVDLRALSPSERARFRNRRLGFVFQQFHLLPRATVLENVLFPLRFPVEAPRDLAEGRTEALRLLEKLSLSHRLEQRPNQLSGGEQQRVAIARALLQRPSLLLADEPTGNLDERSAKATLELFRQLRDEGVTVLMITHDADVAAHADRVLRLENGKLVEDEDARPRARPAVDARPASEASSVARAPAGSAFRRRLAAWRSVAGFAWGSLARNRTRTALTMVGVVFGVAALFAMITFGKYARDQIVQSFEELGSDTVLLRGWPNWNRKATDAVPAVFEFFEVDRDIQPIRRVFPEVRALSPLLVGWGDGVSFGGRKLEGEMQTIGIDSEYQRISRRAIVRGSGISPVHVDRQAAVCLVGPGIVSHLLRDAEPIGKILVLSTRDGGSYTCEIIGVMASQSSTAEFRNPENDVVMPYTYFQKVSDPWSGRIHQFVVQVERGGDVERTGRGIRRWLENRYGPSGYFMVDANSVLVAQLKRSLRLFALLLAAIALVTLGIGGVGIHNMMLVSLAERFKEIGLMKAMGATDESVRRLLLVESVTLAGGAGVVGLALGFATYQGILYLASQVVSRIRFQWIVEPDALVFSLFSIVAVGVASGIVPALRAERLSVVEALRSE